MNKQKQREALARCDGWVLIPQEIVEKDTGFRCDVWLSSSYKPWNKLGREDKGEAVFGETLPAYLTSHDAMQPLIEGLGSPDDMQSDYHKFLHELEQIVFNRHYDAAIDEVFIASDYYLTEPVEVLAEAYLKAKGLWEEGE